MDNGASNQIKLTRYFYNVTERSDALLCNQLQKAAEAVSILIVRPLLAFQKDALICLVSDVLFGYAESPASKLQDSFLIKAINKGMFQVATGEFHLFCYVNGKLDTRAWNKRKAEQMLFSSGRMMF